MIAAGSRVTVAVNGQTNAAQFQIFYTPEMLLGDVRTALERKFDVEQLTVDPVGSVWTGTLPWSYTARVTFRTRVAYTRPEDAASIVATAFYDSAESMPSVRVVANPFRIDPDAPGVEDDNGGGVIGWPTAIAIVGVAIIIVAWKF